MPRLTIIRGLPGAGKSTAARMLAAKTGAIMLEPDMMCVTDGHYIYSPATYGRAKTVVMDMLRNAARMNADVIYCDCLPKRDDVSRVSEEYLKNCFWENVNVEVKTIHVSAMESRTWNIHGVRNDDIEEMDRDWENVPGEEFWERRN